MERFDQKVLSILDDDYQNWITDLKKRYRQSQIKAAIHVNSELIRFYWSLGKDIVRKRGYYFYKFWFRTNCPEWFNNCHWFFSLVLI